jgi:hypothetical protein
MNDIERRKAFQASDELYKFYLRSRRKGQSLRAFIAENRETVDAVIKAAGPRGDLARQRPEPAVLKTLLKSPPEIGGNAGLGRAGFGRHEPRQ